MRIGLLECDDVTGRFPHIAGGYREMFAALLPDASFAHYEAHRGKLPASATECDAWLCTGSKYSVYDGLDWIEALSGFIRKAREPGTPFVGICFGHQMLAHALGGEVARAPQGWGVGILDLDITSPEPWMDPPRERVRLHHMHQDQVMRLPAGAVVLGRSAHCEVGMFRVGDSMLGIEGHPEFTPQFSEALIRARRGRIGAERSEAALASLRHPSDGSLVGRWISRFLRRLT
jgi:GMP synthase-like glutamine amidotransferase